MEFSGIEADSRKVKKGFAFVALRGLTVDGNDFLDDAIKNGAKAVFSEKEKPGWFPEDVEYKRVTDARQKLGELASDFYDNPSQKLKVLGITGTKGKTTTCYLVYHILTGLGVKTGLITSIAAKIGEKEFDTGLHVTNPDALSLNKFLKQMVDEKCKYAVLEVSSHGIDQKRIAGINFAAGVLTNIAPEHLDYHKTFAEYRRVKMSFIKSCPIKVVAPKETQLKILPGKFNNLNVEAALDLVEKLGFDRKSALLTLKTFKLPSGRMEEIQNDLGVKIYVDFAHTPDSLEASLKYLREKTKGRLISVFGCAGERDSRKRSKMGKISTRIADISILTAEDPRTENIFDILKSIKKYATGDFRLIAERGEAIAHALSIAKRGDTLAFFGKGHETSMCYDKFEHKWSDRDFIKNLLNGFENITAVVLTAGKGKRMQSKIPKVLHKIAGRPMVSYTFENLRNAGLKNIVTVVGFKRNLVLREISKYRKYVVQEKTWGTGDAVRRALAKVEKNIQDVLVINGDDSAFYSPETIKQVVKVHKDSKSKITFVTLNVDNPHGLGRVVRDKAGKLKGIVEEKDATEVQKEIKEVNDGLYIFNQKWLRKEITRIKRSPVTGEYYLVELIATALKSGEKVSTYHLPNSSEWQGINTQEELQKAEEKMKSRILNV